MINFKELFIRCKPKKIAPAGEEVHILISGTPERMIPLRLAIRSLLHQADKIHVFLNDFDEIPEFLQHPAISLISSQDFGKLGECGKYYPADDLQGYCLVCSDRLVYPKDYVRKMIAKIEEYGRKAVIAAGGWNLNQPFVDFKQSSVPYNETDRNPEDLPVDLLCDLALAYHTAMINVSRHYFYQPELSSFWFSIIAKEQNIPIVCISHKKNWIKRSEPRTALNESLPETELFKDFLMRSYYIHDKEAIVGGGMGINDAFDRIYVMNLDRRPDRWEKIRMIAEKYHLNITRFPAVDGYKEPVKADWENYFSANQVSLPEGVEPLADYRDKFLKYRHYIARVHYMETKLNRKAIQSPGAWGYALSYISILEEAIRNDYQRILIFDDDIVLHKDFSELIGQYLEALPGNWKLIMLGAMQHIWEPWITPYSELLYHCNGSSIASHAVGIDRKAFLPLLYYCEKMDLPVDEGAIFHIQNVYKKECFIFRPHLVIQDMRESDINSSAMKMNQIDEWMKKFRWNPNDYDFF